MSATCLSSSLCPGKAVRLTEAQELFLAELARHVDPARQSFAASMRWIVDHVIALYRVRCADELPEGLLRAVFGALPVELEDLSRTSPATLTPTNKDVEVQGEIDGVTVFGHPLVVDHEDHKDHKDHNGPYKETRACDPAPPLDNIYQESSEEIACATSVGAQAKPAAVSRTQPAYETPTATVFQLVSLWNDTVKRGEQLWEERNAGMPHARRYWTGLLSSATACRSTTDRVTAAIERVPDLETWRVAFRHFLELEADAVNGARLFDLDRLCGRPKDQYENDDYRELPREERPLFVERLANGLYLGWGGRSSAPPQTGKQIEALPTQAAAGQAAQAELIHQQQRKARWAARVGAALQRSYLEHNEVFEESSWLAWVSAATIESPHNEGRQISPSEIGPFHQDYFDREIELFRGDQ